MTCDQPPALVAHSLGGSLAARFATEHGDLSSGSSSTARPASGGTGCRWACA